jgi:Do/DeqQ family serine protease
MKKTWLFFSQVVTVLVAIWFVLVTLKPQWVRDVSIAAGDSSSAGVRFFEASRTDSQTPAPGSFSAAAKKASPAVVSISTKRKSESANSPMDPWFRFFGGQEDESEQVGLGSGVIVSPEGYILTNNHVIEGADEIEVVLNDARRTSAKFIGSDPDTDIAIIKINLAHLPVIVMGNSDALQIGDQVLAIGNPFGVGQTVTSGIVSALGRNQLGINTFENFIQTDAAINPGNSGGALVDVFGNMMGINTAIVSRSGGSMGIGFAIPMSTAKQVLEGILKDGQVKRGWIGIEPNDLSAELAQTFGLKSDHGVIVTGVLQGGPAFDAGIRPGDQIVEVDSHVVNNVSELLALVASLKPGTPVAFKLQRKDKLLAVSVTPAQRPKVKRSKGLHEFLER